MSDPIAKHRREVLLYILLPIVGTTLLLFALVGFLGFSVASGDLTRTQLTTTASVLLIIFVLLPVGLVMILFDAAFVLLAFGTDKIPRLIVKIVRPLRQLSQKLASYGQKSDIVAEPLILIEKTLTHISVFLEGMIAWFKSNQPAPPEDMPHE